MFEQKLGRTRSENPNDYGFVRRPAVQVVAAFFSLAAGIVVTGRESRRRLRQSGHENVVGRRARCILHVAETSPIVVHGASI